MTGLDARFEYEALGMSFIALLHVLCLISIPIFLIKSLYKKGSYKKIIWKKLKKSLGFSFGNWRYDGALIFREKSDLWKETNMEDQEKD